MLREANIVLLNDGLEESMRDDAEGLCLGLKLSWNVLVLDTSNMC